jgi:hypothetical protein
LSTSRREPREPDPIARWLGDDPPGHDRTYDVSHVSDDSPGVWRIRCVCAYCTRYRARRNGERVNAAFRELRDAFVRLAAADATANDTADRTALARWVDDGGRVSSTDY